jgi:hypothetical protein
VLAEQVSVPPNASILLAEAVGRSCFSRRYAAQSAGIERLK